MRAGGTHGLGGFEAILSATTVVASTDAAVATPSVTDRAGSAVADESAARETAQNGSDDAQGLPAAGEIVNGGTSVGQVANDRMEKPAPNDEVDSVQSSLGDEGPVKGGEESDDERSGIRRDSAEPGRVEWMREAVNGHEAASQRAGAGVGSPHEGQSRGAGRDESPVQSAPQQAAAESRDGAEASRPATARRDELRSPVEPVHIRHDPANARQPAESNHRAQAQSSQPHDQAPPHDRGERNDRESARRDLPFPRERAASLSPAAARAEQIDTAVRLEQATSQRRTADLEPTRSAPDRTGQSSQRPASDRSEPQAAPPGPPAQQSSNPAPSQPPQPTAEPSVRLAPPVEGQQAAHQHIHAPSNATTATADARSEQEPPITSRIVRGLTAMVNQRGGSLTMRLDPPELGSMRVQMTISRGMVAAQITATTAQAHGLLERNLAMLRTALESHGLSVERLTVQLSPPSSQSAMSQHNQQHQQQQDGTGRSAQQEAHADAGEGQSRGRREHEHDHAQPFRHEFDGDFEREFFNGFIQREAAFSTGAAIR